MFKNTRVQEEEIVENMKKQGWERAFKAIGNAVNADERKIAKTLNSHLKQKNKYRLK